SAAETEQLPFFYHNPQPSEKSGSGKSEARTVRARSQSDGERRRASVGRQPHEVLWRAGLRQRPEYEALGASLPALTQPGSHSLTAHARRSSPHPCPDHLLDQRIFERNPFSGSCSSTARTRRIPTKSASVSHQMLLGFCGSCLIQLSSEP